MRPFVPTRGVTSSWMPHEKNASFANMNLSSPGMAAICMSRSSESDPLPDVVRLAEIFTFGYFSVMSTTAFLPDETMMRGFEKVLASSADSSARRTTDISEKSSVPLK